MIVLKTPSEIEIMSEGGKILGEILGKVAKKAKPGISTLELDSFTESLIKNSGAQASFKTVRNYHWATCICLNDVVVHGIPKKEEKLKPGDVVGIDIGLLYRGFHTDISTSFIIDEYNNNAKNKFLETGEKTLEEAIQATKPGNFIGDISKIIQTGIEKQGYQVVKELVGHGIGKNLHEDPQIPGWFPNSKKTSDTQPLRIGTVLALEVIYTMGKADIFYKDDGWTIKTRDGNLAGLFEKTVAVTKTGPKILTP